MASTPDNQPIVVLGAARSGTKMLRGLIAAADGMRPVPYDVNYIWKYGNEGVPHDELGPAHATPRTANFIRKQLQRCASGTPQANGPIVEKTVGNILRIPFVATVLPEARYVVLIRDGRDVIESAWRCWQEPPRLGYLAAKLRTFPWLSCAGYGWRFATGTAGRMTGLRNSLPSWGPRYEGIDEDVAQCELLEVCARQWANCMTKYGHDRGFVASDRLLEIRYEQLVDQPSAVIERLSAFLNIPQAAMLRHAEHTIRAGNVGKFRKLDSQQLKLIDRAAGAALAEFGYAPAGAEEPSETDIQRRAA